MTFDGSDIFEWVQALLMVSLGAVWAMLRDEMKTARRDHRDLAERVAKIELDVAERTVPRAEYHEDMREIRSLLQDINNKIDAKVDKK